METIDAKIFTCPNCGAEVFATNLDAIEYCSYCGTFVTLESRLAKIQKPSYILPFTVTKEKCLELYTAELNKSPFLPKYMKAENAESNMKNFYVPFWVFNQKINPDADIPFIAKEEYWNGEHYRKEYDITAKINGNVDGIIFDASVNLDDCICEEIGNFSVGSLKPFNSSLMAGSYADVADVKSEIYNEDAYRKGMWLLADRVKSECERKKQYHTQFFNYNRNPNPIVNGKPTQKTFTPSPHQNVDECSDLEPKLAMLPVWFMTYKNKKRLNYAVINGHTGKMFTEIPIDTKKFFLWSLLISVPFFLIFELAFRFDFAVPENANLIWLITFFLAIVVPFFVSKNFLNKTNQANDKGRESVFGKKSKKKIKKFGFVQLGIILALLGSYFVTRLYGDKSIIPGYVSSIVNVIVIFVSIASKNRNYNLECSRPVPHFFDKRKEAGK